MLHNVRQPFNVTSLAQVAAIAGMDDRAHIARTLQVNAEGMAYLEREFARLKLPFVPSHANFFLVDVGDGRAIYDQLLRKGVIVRPIAWIRISAARANQRRAARGESPADRDARRSDGRAVVMKLQRRNGGAVADYRDVRGRDIDVAVGARAGADPLGYFGARSMLTGSKFTGLLLLPIVSIAGYLIIGLTAVFSPEQFRGRAMSALSWFRLAYVAVMAGVYGVIVADVRGANLNMNYVVLPLLAIMMIAIANLLIQTNRNKSAKSTPPSDGGIQV